MLNTIAPETPSERTPTREADTSERIFRPNYLSFAGTYQCNLSCPHCCVPIEWTDRLAIAPAIRFLEEAHAIGIELLGFTGGEPFLYPEFVIAISRRAAELGFRFDKLMTNGVWYRDVEQLRQILTELKSAGFQGKIGLSIDKFHGIATAKLADFCRVVREVFARDSILSLSYASREPTLGLEPIHRLAKELDAVIQWSKVLGRYLFVSDEFTMTLNWNHLATVERAEKLPGDPWDGQWFVEDYCEGPGQALIVNPRGEVKPCCGFASDLDQLCIGNIKTDSAKEVIANGRAHPVVGKIFRDGLSALKADAIAKNPDAFPGATSNHCYFCWYVLTKNLLELPTNLPGTQPNARRSLPMAGEVALAPVALAGQHTTSLLMAFDGKIVYLSRELTPQIPLQTSRVYLIQIVGPTTVEPQPTMTWTDYQTWIDSLRQSGHTLTTHTFTGCQK